MKWSEKVTSLKKFPEKHMFQNFHYTQLLANFIKNVTKYLETRRL